MLKKISTATLLISSLSMIQAARAEIPGFYASAQLGYGNTHINTSNLVNVANAGTPIGLPNLNNNAIAYRLAFGYQMNENFAVEFGYRRFSNTDISASGTNYSAGASSKERAFDLVGKSIVPLINGLSAYGKLGIAYVKANSQGYASATSPATTSFSSYSNTLEPTFGLGLSYNLKPNVPIDISWNRIQKLGGNNHAPSSDFYAVGVSYYFG
ncbi:MAG: outer membrane beta-barrel protein [Rickettsiella sp.]|nr:outer membrane beta-barrel protein [Rickettsiella sp.]